MRSFESLFNSVKNGLKVHEQRPPRIVLLPGWWFEILSGVAACACLGLLLGFGASLPRLLPLVLFAVMMIAAENTSIVLPTETSVSPAFMIVMAAIAAFGHHGAVVGASIVGLSGVFNLDTIRRRRYTAAFSNGGQYLLASAAAAATYQSLAAVGPPAAFAGAVLAFAIINVGLVLPQIVLDYEEPARDVWADMRPALPNYFGFGLLGVLVGVLYSSLGPTALILLVIPALIARKAFASFLELRAAHDATVKVFIKAIEAKDPYTAGHTERVAKYARCIGVELKLSATDLEHLHYAALLHDVGKLAVPRRILNKAGRLTEQEYAIVQRHNKVCVDILTRVDFMSSMVGTASDRHAHYAGQHQSDHDRLVQEAHIVAVADAFDAMTSTRSYRRALTQDVAFAELRAKSGTQFNPECVEALIRSIERSHEVYGLGYEARVEEFDVPPPIVGVGSAGLGDLIREPKPQLIPEASG